MNIIVNDEKISKFVYDSLGEFKAPMDFEQSDMTPHSKKIFKNIAKYCIDHDTNIMPIRKFQKMVIYDFGATKETVYSMAELESNSFLKLVKLGEN